MLRRLLLTILALCLAAPAMAVPLHCVPQPQVAMHHVMAADGDHAGHHGKVPADAQKPHDCIGCCVPQLGAGSIPNRMPYPAVPAVAREDTLALIGADGPETPPPRA